MLAFYLDHNIPAAVANGLRRRGIDVITAFEDGFDCENDPTIFDRAQALHRVFFTHDYGFLRMAAARQRTGEDFVGLVFAHQNGFNVGAGIRHLLFLADNNAPEQMRNRVDYIPARGY
ncbi:MAG TPA: DUF5615 family PIN-like protein [Phycisphaerae bacterium]|nr:DUF5615 family PIN-like protein [Phycisphaerae bacterium]